MTGRLAEPALRRQLEALAPVADFDNAVAVLPISVAALATTSWIARHLSVPPEIDRIVLPGLCAGEVDVVEEQFRIPTAKGPADLRDLPEYFGRRLEMPDSGGYDITILAEINHVPRLDANAIMALAHQYRADGADIIDLGCDPGTEWTLAGEVIRRLRAEDFRVSIDSFNPREVTAATNAGAELVLSVNSSNRAAARDWGCEVVAIPDEPATLRGLDETVETLAGWGIPFRIDPILEPIGLGFSSSLGRYLEVRRRYPQAEMLMGVGNLTELTDADSAAINVVLLGFCQELGIRSVLTTQVINWCRSCVRELDLARRLVAAACRERIPPKRIEPNLVLLRDPKLSEFGDQTLRELAANLRDRNFRIFAERGAIHVMNGTQYLQGTDPFALFRDLHAGEPIDAAHAFYLGYEMAKAATALTLGKNYVQDRALHWGFLTVPEIPHGGTMVKGLPEVPRAP